MDGERDHPKWTPCLRPWLTLDFLENPEPPPSRWGTLQGTPAVMEYNNMCVRWTPNHGTSGREHGTWFAVLLHSAPQKTWPNQMQPHSPVLTTGRTWYRWRLDTRKKWCSGLWGGQSTILKTPTASLPDLYVFFPCFFFWSIFFFSISFSYRSFQTCSAELS